MGGGGWVRGGVVHLLIFFWNIFIHRSILYIAGPKIYSDIHRYSPEDNIFDFQQIV